MTLADDPRVTPVENSLFDFFTGVGNNAVMSCHIDLDVCQMFSDVYFPLFNGAVRARFARDEARRRTNEVLDQLVAHGQPFLWWLTPTTRSPVIEAVLVQRGLVPQEPTTGMHVALTDLPTLSEPSPDGVTVEASKPATLTTAARTMLDGFGLPTHLLEPFRALLAAEPTGVELVNLLATVEGRPVGAGSVLISDGVAGLYNIAVPEEARGRGIGRAVTVELMRVGARAGCRESVLHATELGLPVYRKLGYDRVCDVQQYLWLPPELTPA